MNCACATFRLKLEKFRRNFSSLNSMNSKWRRLVVDPVVMCQQGEFDCNESPMLLKHREKTVIKGYKSGRRNISCSFGPIFCLFTGLLSALETMLPPSKYRVLIINVLGTVLTDAMNVDFREDH